MDLVERSVSLVAGSEGLSYLIVVGEGDKQEIEEEPEMVDEM